MVRWHICFGFASNFVDFGMKFFIFTLRFMDMISLQTQRWAFLAGLTSSRLSATERLYQYSIGWLLLRKLFYKYGTKIHPQEVWLVELSNTLYMEKIRFELSGKSDRFHQIWQPFLDHITERRRPSWHLNVLIMFVHLPVFTIFSSIILSHSRMTIETVGTAFVLFFVFCFFFLFLTCFGGGGGKEGVIGWVVLYVLWCFENENE